MKRMSADVLSMMQPVHLEQRGCLGVPSFSQPTVFLLMSPYSTKQTMTVKVIVTLGLPRVLRLFALLAFLTLAAIAV